MPLLHVWDRLRSIFTRPTRDLEAMQFSLGDRPAPDGSDGGSDRAAGGGSGGGSGGGAHRGGGVRQGQGGARKGGKAQGRAGQQGVARQGTAVRGGAAAHGTRQLIGGAWPGQKQGPPQRQALEGEPIPKDIEAAISRLSQIFHFPESKDIVFRKFVLDTRPRTRAFLLYIEGMADTKRVESEILYPLMKLPREARTPKGRLPEQILNMFLPPGTSERKFTIEEIIAGVVMGEVAVILETGCAILCDVKGPPSRQPSEPLTERTVRGPQIGFTESHRTNTAMIRSFVHDPDMVVEQMTVGRRTKTLVSVIYISDIANPRLVDEVRRRLANLDVESVTDSGSLERLIEDHPLSLVPTILSTERPDRAAYLLQEGTVVIVVGGSTRCLIVPATFSLFLHTAEDIYLKFQFVAFLRVLRLGALFVALLLPGFFVAIVNYHQEMIPPPLLLTFAAAQSAIPFPLVFNITAMEFSFELIREAGLRVPSAIGATIGIVGALLLGDMAVRSGLVSPIVVIIVAITALASFTIPEPESAIAARLARFAFIVLGGTLGFYGVALGIFILGSHLASMKSFGVPYLSPIGPWRAGSLDVILRGPVWDQEKRRIYLRPLDLIRQARYARAWDPGVPGETQAPKEPAESGREPENQEPEKPGTGPAKRAGRKARKGTG